MPSVQLYGKTVTFHTWGTPLDSTAGGFNTHQIWSVVNPMILTRPHIIHNDFDRRANVFAGMGLAGYEGNTGASSWPFTGTTGENWGTAVAYQAEMLKLYYTSRGMTYGPYAFVPQDAGEHQFTEAGAAASFLNQYAIFAGENASGVVVGATGDRLQLFTWTGSTAEQNDVLNSSIYCASGITSFSLLMDDFLNGFYNATLASSTPAKLTIMPPSFIAYDNEDQLGPNQFVSINNDQEVGSWIQTVNDPRVNTYNFFNRATLKQIWGATGNTSQAFRSPHQRSQTFSITGPNNLGNITVTSDYVDIIYSQRLNGMNYTPSWQNFRDSLILRQKEYTIAQAWSGYAAGVQANWGMTSEIGNYECVPSTRRYWGFEGKIGSYTYTCDVTCTGPNSETGYTSSSITGTFALDYAAPVLYVRSPEGDAEGYQNFLPGFSVFMYKNYSGAYGSSSLVTMQATGGLYSQGDYLAAYSNFLQYCGKAGVTSVAGGGTAEGFTGNNVVDLKNFLIAWGKMKLDHVRGALNSFDDNASKPIRPWIGSFVNRYNSIFSLTASSSSYPFTVYNDVNGLTGYQLNDWDPWFIDYNVDIVKYGIQTHNITDWMVFDGALTYSNGADTSGITAANFWYDVINSLVMDSGGGGGGGGTSSSSGIAYSTNSSSVIWFAGRLYTREEFNRILQAYYRR